MRNIKLLAVVMILVLVVSLFVGCDSILNSKGKYVIRYYTDGGLDIGSKIVSAGEELPFPEDTVKDGYTFGGWYLDIVCTEPLDLSSPFIVNENITLYARWLNVLHWHEMEFLTEKAPTATEEGYVLTKCKDKWCNYMQKETIPPLG